MCPRSCTLTTFSGAGTHAWPRACCRGPDAVFRPRRQGAPQKQIQVVQKTLEEHAACSGLAAGSSPAAGPSADGPHWLLGPSVAADAGADGAWLAAGSPAADVSSSAGSTHDAGSSLADPHVQLVQCSWLHAPDESSLAAGSSAACSAAVGSLPALSRVWLVSAGCCTLICR
jgi:hypothetical protein